MTTSWYGARPAPGGARFRLWAPGARSASVVLHDGRAAGSHILGRDAEGVYDRIVDGAAAGDRYGYSIDGGEPRPDPAARFQPDGVHGPSQIVDPLAFAWTDAAWRGRPARDLVLYELHVGTFSADGTFAGTAACLEPLRDLGITAIELMPVAAAAGSRNWGYDSVALYSPFAAYGTPDDLRRLIDRAHHFGLAVILDVVYNHLGPEGAYLPGINPDYLTSRHSTPWGHAVNVYGPGSDAVRRFIIGNVEHWIGEYHADGLRLDATHALIDDGPSHIVRDIVAAAHAAAAGREIVVHAEDHRNLAMMVQEMATGGWGLDAVWADDFHHVMRRLLAGDSRGYYGDFTGSTEELAATIRQGWLYTGQASRHMGGPRGTDASQLPMYRFIVCLQNHDQIGNRATGDRLSHAISPAAWRAASAVLLTVPMTPLLFMGQEWAATSPFQYFTDLEPELGRLVTEGRRREFADFPEFAEAPDRIPDPQALATFEASRLRWRERAEPAHAAVLRLYEALLALRRRYRALAASEAVEGEADALDADTIAVRRRDEDDEFLVVARLRGAGRVDVGAMRLAGREDGPRAADWDVALTTEDALFAPDSVAITVDRQPDGPVIGFGRPGAVILKRR